MNPDLLLAHFNRISDAPDAISRLRRFILDLAVRGKLVEQDRDDEPASVLLKRIETEKARLVKEGKIRRQDQTQPVEKEEQPFTLPATWVWAHFGGIADFSAGRTPSRHDFSFWNTGDHSWVSIADMKDGGEVTTTEETISEKAKSQVFGSDPEPIGTLIMSFKLTIGKISKLAIPAFHNEAIISVRPHEPQMDRYLFKVLPQFSRQGDTKNAIKGATLNRDSIAKILLPLPPLSEQHRIIAKVDELMALCDRLEDMQRDRENRRDRLAAASHFHLNNGAAGDLRAQASFYLNNLPQLTITSQQISSLRQTILDLAVHGRLVRRSDELGEERNPTKSLSSDAKFPAHWSIQPLTNVAASIVDCPHSTPKWTTKGKICVRTNQFRPGKLDLSTVRFVSESTYLERIQRLEPVENDILYSREGGILGVACRVPPNTQLCLGQRMMLIRPGAHIDPAFLEMVLNSPLITGIALAKTTGGAAPRINVATVKAYPIPLPSLAEQQRIVAKVNELMALCDRLESQLTNVETETGRLLEAVLHHTLSDAFLRDTPQQRTRNEVC
jgi:type I restriction enzyme S subunit